MSLCAYGILRGGDGDKWWQDVPGNTREGRAVGAVGVRSWVLVGAIEEAPGNDRGRCCV